VNLVTRHAALSDIGLHRQANEDAYIAEAPLFAVADGMGGARAGEVAAGIAIETLAQTTAAGGSLQEAAAEANTRIYDLAAEDPDRAGMGTTLTAVRIVGAQADFVHIGDSRAYLLRGGELRQLSEDHSLVGEWVREGAITPEEAAVNRYRSILSRALGTEPQAELDVFSVELEPGDVLLLSSDGLSGVVPSKRLAKLLAKDDLQACVRGLVREAKEHGGHDNITAVVVRLEAAVEPAEDGEVTADVALSAADEAADAPSSKAAAEAAAAPPPPRAAKRPPVSRLLIVAVLVAVLLITAAVAANELYFVGVDQGYVSVFRGLPWQVGSLEFHRLYFRSTVSVAALNADQRQRVERHSLGSKGAALDLVRAVGGSP
jgi:PPM family protein phosphatase